MDLGFHGPKFIWTNKNPIWHRNIKECLDRGLGNAKWKLTFPRSKIHHLPHTKSDHCPMLLDIDPLIHKLPKPFKFEQMWLTNPSFSTLVENSLHTSESLPSSSSPQSRFQHHLKYLTSNIID